VEYIPNLLAHGATTEGRDNHVTSSRLLDHFGELKIRLGGASYSETWFYIGKGENKLRFCKRAETGVCRESKEAFEGQ
jgi:hypothetical protein